MLGLLFLLETTLFLGLGRGFLSEEEELENLTLSRNTQEIISSLFRVYCNNKDPSNNESTDVNNVSKLYIADSSSL